MKLYLGSACGNLVTLDFVGNDKKDYEFLNIKLCANFVGPILKTEKKDLIIGLDKNTIEIINTGNRKKRELIKHQYQNFADICSINNPDLFIFVAVKKFIYVWKKNCFNKWGLVYKITSMCKIDLITKILPSKLIVTSNAESRNLNIWNIFENKVLFCGKATIQDKTIGIDGSPYNDYFIIRTCKGDMQVYSNTGDCLRILCEHNNRGKNYLNSIQHSLKFYDQTTVISGGSNKNLLLWDFRVNKIVREWPGHRGEIKMVDRIESIDHPQRYLVISCDIFDTIKMWDIRSDKEFRSFKFGSFKMNSTKFV
nr:G-protein beta WD-40 repeats containing protein [Cryptomonas sp.]